MTDIVIDRGIKALIPPLKEGELEQLERNLLAEGCRDALVLWHGPKTVLLDGHNRFALCTKHDISFKTVTRKFKDRDEAKAWVIRNQMGRRNLEPFQRCELALALEPLIAAEAKKNQGQRTDLSPTLAEGSVDTRETIAKAANVSHGTLAKAKKLVAEADDETLDALRSGEFSINKAYTDIRREEKEQKRKSRRATNKAKVQKTSKVSDLKECFSTLVVDPPWDWGDEGDVDQMGRAKPTYATMSIDELKALKIGALADKDAHIFLWITNRSLPKGFGLLETWGFRYVTCLTWCKPSIGMGNYFRGSTEQVLFGVKGSQPLKRKDVGTWFKAKRGKQHSAKPVEFMELVESCSPGPYLEVFARSKRKGWTSWGAEA